MTLTADELAMIQASVPVLHSHGEKITRHFYESLLQAEPSLHNVFNSANQANGRQPRALLCVILAFASAPSHLADLAPRMERVCHKHVSLGVEPDQYPIVGQFLLRAFADVLGDAWTSELEATWAKAYGLLANMFVAREQQLYNSFGPWHGFAFMRIKRKVREAEGVYSFHLEPLDGDGRTSFQDGASESQDKPKPLAGPLPPFTPGQYVSVRVEVPSIGYLQARQYSLSDAPSADEYRITVRRSRGVLSDRDRDGVTCPVARSPPGLVSNILIDHFSEGDTLGVSHPAGGVGFDPSPEDASPVVLVSAGSGATPLMSIFNAVQGDRSVRWVHYDAAQDKEPLAFEKEVTAVAGQRESVRAAFERGCDFADEDDRTDWEAKSKHLAKELEGLEGKGFALLETGATHYYVSGPTRFTRQVARFFEEKGVTQDRIHSEWFATGSLDMSF